MRNLRHTCTLVILALLLAGAYAYAQTATGNIVGKVTDAQGAIIVSAKVTATEVGTGRSRTIATNAEGLYEFALLPPGRYEVTAEAPSMAKMMMRVELLLGAHPTVNFAMQPAGSKTTVEVTGEAPAIETTNSELKANIDPKQMSELPLNGRTFSSLAILAPGVRPMPSFDPTKARIGTVSVGGSIGRDFNLTVDGGDNKDNIVGGLVQNFTTEGIQEFVIDTHRFGADTGKSAGGVMTIATKGGSNALHGGGFFYLRNRNLNAMDYFTAHQDNPQKAPFDKQNYGGSFSGPIKKDKLFFFTAIEHQKEMNQVAQNQDALNTMADFVHLRELAPISFPELQNLPVSLATHVPVPFLDTQFQGRVDYNVNSNNQVFFRYAQQNNHLTNDMLSGWADISHGAVTTNDLNSFLANWTTTINSNTLNQFMFQYSHFYNSMQAPKVGNNITELCFSDGTCIGMNEDIPQTTTQNKLHFRDDFSWRKGKHAIKFGAQDIYTPSVGGTIAYDVSPWVASFCQPSEILENILSPNPDPTKRPCNGATSLDAPGVIDNVGLAGGNPSYLQHGIHQLSYYFQDDLKISPRLTLNLGIRNDIDFGLVPTDQQKNNRALKILDSMGIHYGIPHTDLNNWAPRVGFAWDVLGKGNWVLRGGYGFFYDQPFLNTLLQSIPQGNPEIFAVLYQAYYDQKGAGAVGLSPALQTVVNNVGMWPIEHNTELPWGSRGRFISPDFQTPYSQQFTFGTQLGLGKNMTLSVDYVHSLGLHEFAQKDINPRTDGTSNSPILYPLMDATFGCWEDATGIIAPLPEGETICNISDHTHRLSRIQQMTSDSRSRYDSLTFDLKRRFNKNFSFGASYVLARAVGYSQAFDWGSEAQGVYPGLTGWETALRGIIGPQDFGYLAGDERHRLVLNGILELKGGFTVSAIGQFSSGRPYAMSAGHDTNGDGVNNDYYSNVLSYDPVYDARGWGDARYSLRMPNQLRGDPYYQLDLRAQKTFKFGERFKLAIVADMFNIFNRANFGNNFQSTSDGYDSAIQPDVPATADCPGRVYPCTFAPANKLPRIPTELFGGGYGGAGTIGIPFQAQFGLRLSF